VAVQEIDVALRASYRRLEALERRSGRVDIDEYRTERDDINNRITEFEAYGPGAYDRHLGAAPTRPRVDRGGVGGSGSLFLFRGFALLGLVSHVSSLLAATSLPSNENPTAKTARAGANASYVSAPV